MVDSGAFTAPLEVTKSHPVCSTWLLHSLGQPAAECTYHLCYKYALQVLIRFWAAGVGSVLFWTNAFGPSLPLDPFGSLSGEDRIVQKNAHYLVRARASQNLNLCRFDSKSGFHPKLWRQMCGADLPPAFFAVLKICTSGRSCCVWLLLAAVCSRTQTATATYWSKMNQAGIAPPLASIHNPLQVVLLNSLSKFPPFGEFIAWSCINAAAAVRSERGQEVEPQEVERHIKNMWNLDALV